MRQKVGFARAMAVEPELLCLDEPFSALDVLSAEALRGELMELWTAKSIPTRAILMVTHNIEEAALMADRLVVMGKNPGHVVAEIPITLRHPRRRKDTAFQALTDKVYAAVTGKRDAAEPSAGAAPQGRKPALPRARLNAIAGLLEKVAAEGGRADLYRLSGELAANLGDMLPVVEAAEKLGFLTVGEGDLVLTALGEAYAEAKILARKELLAGRALRLPLIAWVYETLQQDDDGRVAKEYFVESLQCDFGERAEEQVNTAIQWGRAAELFDYDMDRDELFIEN
jgi:NitT/TauT family transport system ATP-binding protein